MYALATRRKKWTIFVVSNQQAHAHPRSQGNIYFCRFLTTKHKHKGVLYTTLFVVSFVSEYFMKPGFSLAVRVHINLFWNTANSSYWYLACFLTGKRANSKLLYIHPREKLYNEFILGRNTIHTLRSIITHIFTYTTS